MSLTRTLAISLCLSLSALLAGGASAQTFDAFDRGWYDDTGFHDDFNNNTVTGLNAGGSTLFNSFFTFDLTGLTGVSSGTLRLELEGYFSGDPSEDFTVSDVVTDVLTLNATNFGRIDIFNDLQSGAVYGAGTATPGDVGSVLEIPLSAAAIADINAAAGGLFAVGVHVDQITIPFGNEALRWSGSSEPRTHQLVLVSNLPPDCTVAAPDVDVLWPPNHQLEDVSVIGVTDPDGDPVTISITAVAQDEPPNGVGDGNTCPDANGVGTDIASVRAERAGTKGVSGDGRVYHVSFTAEDGQGGECSGAVTVCVPHDQSNGSTCVDGGPIFDSTICEGDLEAAVSAAGFARNCGIGFELALLAPALMWLCRRGRRRAQLS